MRSLAAALLLSLACALCTERSYAQVPISGAVYDGAGGPLLSGQVYHAVGNVQVPAGRTLTVQQDVVIKFAPGTILLADGDLTVLGTSALPVVVTSWSDDSIAGDSWGDGPTTGTAGDWGGVVAGALGSVDLDHTLARFGGGGGFGLVSCGGGDVTLRDCTIEKSSNAGLDLFSFGVPVVVEDCSFQGNAGWPVQNLFMSHLSGFSGNTASGNGSGDAVLVTASTLAGDLTIVEDNLLNGTMALFGLSSIAFGATLTFGAGVTVKHIGTAGWIVSGTLRAFGTGSDPVVFTSISDDDYAGDTANDGPTSGTPGQWDSIDVDVSGTLELTDTVVRYAGSNTWRAIRCSGGELDLLGCTFERNVGAGLDLQFTDATLDVQDCAFDDNTGWPVDLVTVHDVSGFLANTASGNQGGSAMRMGHGYATEDVDIWPENLINGCLVMTDDITPGPGSTVTLHAGTVFKPMGSLGFFADGTLRALGTEADPVVFTSLFDDTICGDTNADGPSTGSPGDWLEFLSFPGGSMELNHSLLRFAGSSASSAVRTLGGALQLRNCEIRETDGTGIDLDNFDVPCEVVDCSFVDNAGFAVDDALIPVLEGFDSNTASGNALGDFIRVTDGTVARAASIGPRNTINGALVVQSWILVNSSAVLEFTPGLVVKFAGIQGFDVSGSLEALGTARLPVVLTSYTDDEHAGDTNGDGVSTGVPGQWFGVSDNPPGTLLMENVLLRHAGASNFAGILNNSPGGGLRAVRVEHCQAIGFYLAGQPAEATNLIAFENGSDGLFLNTSDPEVLHATSVGNGGFGIAKNPAVPGLVRNSISWGNTLGNFNGYFAGEILYSDGAPDAPANGNLSVNPQFLDVSGGDLHLASTSPVIDQADFAVSFGVVRDADEHSRILRSTATGQLLPDMGAHEHARWTFEVGGVPAIGEPLAMTVVGAPGVSIHGYGLMDGSILLDPYGFLMAGLNPVYVLNTAAVGTTRNPVIPAKPGLVGLELGLQAFAIDAVDVSLSHLTNLVRIELEPALP